jgi:hypothetical protein
VVSAKSISPLYSGSKIRTCQIGTRLYLVSPYFSADMTSTQGMSYNDNFQYSAMEVMGYTKVQTGAPPRELVTEVERSLRSRPNVVSGPVTYGRGDHDACENYLKFGIQNGDVCSSTRGRYTELTSMEVHQEDRRSAR